MFYYSFNIGDYQSHTSHLSEMEDLAYRRMLDWCYLHEKPLPDEVDEIARQIRMRSHSDCIAVVLREYFVRTDDGWISERVQFELSKIADKSDKARKSAEARWSTKKTDANASETHNGRNAIPIHQDTNTQIHQVKATRGSRLPADWKPNAELAEWSKAERPDLDLRKVFAEFKDYWSSIPGTKGVRLDWDATWRNWARKQTAPKQSFAQQAADVARTTVPPPPNQDAALKQIIADREKCSPPPAHIREMMKGILGVKNA